MTKANEQLADSELVRVINHLTNVDEITDHDRGMSDFVMTQIHSCSITPEDFIYENVRVKKFFLDVHGGTIPRDRDAYSPSNRPYLYRLLPMSTTDYVGGYYYCLRLRPEKKGMAYEYIPNAKHRYRDVKRTLLKIKIQVLSSRM
jgi:hypothetical protein